MAYLKTKTGVTPRALTLMAAIGNVAGSLQEPNDVTITAGTNGTHMKDSKHYSGEALDVRTKNFPTLASKQAFVAAVLKRLGKGYQGFLESIGKDNEHAHFEWDPQDED